MRDIFSADFGLTALTGEIENGYIVRLAFGAAEPSAHPEHDSVKLWDRARGELEEYFSGARREFDLPIYFGGTDFQRRVWEALRGIPYGEVRTYGGLAGELGQPRAARAVGGACHKNPIVIIIPCHRVVGASGRLTGFAGGLETKRHLLTLEAHIGKA